jgi:chromosome segregation ATPase
MKRLLLILVLGAALGAAPARAQNLVGDAARQELEDRLRRAERDLESVKEANESLRKKLADLQRATDTIAEAAARSATSSKNILQATASKEELHQLRDALKESESRREADKKLFLEKFEELRKLMAAAPAAPSFSAPPSGRTSKAKAEPAAEKSRPLPPGVPDTGVYHVIEKNQTALEILKAYNDDLKAKGRASKISLAQLQAANPGVNLDRLRTGQKLFIPIPEK